MQSHNLYRFMRDFSAATKMHHANLKYVTHIHPVSLDLDKGQHQNGVASDHWFSVLKALVVN